MRMDRKKDNANYFKKTINNSIQSNELSLLPYFDPLPKKKMYKKIFMRKILS